MKFSLILSAYLLSNFTISQIFTSKLDLGNNKHTLINESLKINRTTNSCQRLINRLENDSCIFFNNYDKINYTADTTAFWSVNSNPIGINENSSILTVREELRIPAGVNITISGLTLKFAPNAKIIIENGNEERNGGKLILTNGAKLTVDERCGNTWQGVEVWGQTNFAQNSVSNTKQGVLIVQGNSAIEFALIGVLASKRETSTTFDDAFNGGIVQINKGNLLNNQRGVWIRNYHSPSGVNNISFFTNAKFEWSNIYQLTQLRVEEHLRLDEVTGILIKGCVFNNHISINHLGSKKRGRGIVSNSSNFLVNDFCYVLQNSNLSCDSSLSSSFSNLEFGLFVTSSDVIKSFCIQNAVFTNNRYGIYGTGITDPKIISNDFYILEDDLDQSAGVALYFSTGYTIEGNNFEEFDNTEIADGLGQSYGIVINNSGTSDNEVYRNTFSKLKVGGLSEGTNGETYISGSTYYDTKGLRWTCNTFNAPIYQTDLGINGIIAYQQGYPIPTSVQAARMNAARNKFSMSGESASLYPNHDIWSTPISQAFNYTHLADLTHVPDNYTALNVYMSPATALGIPVFSSSDMCPSQIVHDITFSNLKMAELKQEISLSKEKLSNGSDENLVLLIENQTDESQIVDVLLGHSPYLSDAVLLSMIGSPYSENSKFQILVANTPLSVSVQENLINADLGSLHLEELYILSVGETPIQKLRSEINFMEFEWNKLYHRNLQEYLFDETAVDYSGLKDYLSSVDDETAVKMRYDILLSEKQFSEVNEIKQNNSFTDHREFIKLQEIKEELVKSTNDEELLAEEEELRTKLEQIHQSESNDELASKSQAILEKVVGLFDVPEFNPLFAPLYRANPTNQTNTTLISKESDFSVFPNPSNDVITLAYENWKSLNLDFQIFDVRGAKVRCPQISLTENSATFETKNLKEGVYVLKVIDNQVCVQVLKFVVKH